MTGDGGVKASGEDAFAGGLLTAFPHFGQNAFPSPSREPQWMQKPAIGHLNPVLRWNDMEIARRVDAGSFLPVQCDGTPEIPASIL
jgi:hypothetical protein